MFEAIVAGINDRLADANVVGQDGLPLACLMGAENLLQNDRFPRIVVDPTEDDYTQSDEMGRNPQSRLTVWQGADVHIWAADFDDCRNYINAFLFCLFRAVSGAPLMVKRGRWVKRTLDLQHGRAYVLQIAVAGSIVETPWAITPKPISMTHTGEMVFPKGDGGGPDVVVDAC